MAQFLTLLLAVLMHATVVAHEGYLVRSWHSEDGLPSNSVRAVAQDAMGYLWIATAEGVVRFDGVRFSSEVWGQAYPSPRSLFTLDNGEVWVATMRGGLWRWAGGKMKMVWAEQEEQEPRSIKSITTTGKDDSVIQSSDGTYLMVAGAEPVKLEKTELPTTSTPSSLPQGAITAQGKQLDYMDRRGRLWMRTVTGALLVAESGQTDVTFPVLDEGIYVTALLEDREGTLWVATNGSGLYQVRERRIHVIDSKDGLSDLKVRALLQDQAGALWAANRNGGIDHIQNNRVQTLPVGSESKPRLIVSICEDRHGTIWVAKDYADLYRRREHGFEKITKTSPWLKKASSLLSDQKGGLWLGGPDGLLHWRAGKTQLYTEKHGLPAHTISALALDVDQQLWIGQSDGRLSLLHGDTCLLKGSSGGDAISSVLGEKEEGAWAATLGSGLLLYRHGKLTRFDAVEGLSESRLTCVLDDDDGYLWVGSLAGIFRVAKNELFQIAEGKLTQANWLQLDRADGMISRECTGGFQPAGWRGRDGTLHFPTVHGIASIQPKSLHLNLVPPLVQIESVRTNGREILQQQDDALQTGPGRARIEFRYTALSLAAPEKVRFRTRLVGFQDDWQEAGTQRQVAYEAVPPGNYLLRVIAANNDGVWSEHGAELRLRVLPHYWETIWFRSLAIITVLSLVFGIGAMIARARARMKLLRMKAETARILERERIAQDLHDDLGASLTEISLLAGLAVEEENKSQNTMPMIAAKSQRLVSALDEIVWAVNPRHDTLASFVDYLTASAAELLDAAGISLRLEIAEGVSTVELDSVHRHALYLASREALNNAVKHSGASELRLALSFLSNQLDIVIKDNGKGFQAQETRLCEGLLTMKSRLKALGGECQIVSNASGTQVTFSLKLREKG